jgi:hypothetical protein
MAIRAMKKDLVQKRKGKLPILGQLYNDTVTKPIQICAKAPKCEK